MSLPQISLSPLSLPLLPALLKGSAFIAMAIGVGVGAAVLWAPAPSPLPPVLNMTPDSRPDLSSVAQWFGGAALRVRVAAAGAIASADGRGAALLSVDGGAIRAYRVGQSLAPGVVLHSVGSDAVMIDQDGVVERVPLPVPASTVAGGFVPARR